MTDIDQMFNSTEQTQLAALGIEALEAIGGGNAMAKMLKRFRAAPWTFQEGLKTAVIGGAVATAYEEAKQRTGNSAFEWLTGWDLLNPANTVAERQEQMAEQASGLTYATIKNLQAQLARMLDLYDENCNNCRR